jgi:pyridoxal phosphate enzyme (YggS family)
VTISTQSVAERLHAVRDRIQRAGGVGVRIVAVTKTFGVEALVAASAAGADGIGENYAQELVAKLAEVDVGDLPPVHFIGQLQSNKVRSVAPFVAVYETVDRPSLAAALARRVPGATVLVQVRPDVPEADAGKAGCTIDDAPALVDQCRELGLHPVGLMTVGPTVGGSQAARPGFAAVRALVDQLGLTVCSMGMTDDLEVAVGEGSTQVRVGSALFGARPPR